MTFNNEKGIVYIIILFLLIIISSLGLAFISKTSISTSVISKRSEAMQAQYLAESAANHALWRLLNDSDFHPHNDKYYMHSLAGGRYGYKVRMYTSTTFATIATVGVTANDVVYQSYVLYVKP